MMFKTNSNDIGVNYYLKSRTELQEINLRNTIQNQYRAIQHNKFNQMLAIWLNHYHPKFANRR